MRGWFASDGPIIRTLGSLADVMIINFFTLLLCLPVITAGAAITAMYYVYLKLAKSEEGNIVKQFFASFRENFKQASILWLGMLVLGALVFFNFRALVVLNDRIPFVFKVAVILLTLLLFMVLMYIFPLLSRFQNSIGGTVKNAALMAFAAFPKTLVMALLLLVIPLLVYFLARQENGTILVFRILPLAFMPGITLPCYFQSFIFRGIFRRYEPEGATGEEDA